MINHSQQTKPINTTGEICQSCKACDGLDFRYSSDKTADALRGSPKHRNKSEDKRNG